jgi:hypothetical protein
LTSVAKELEFQSISGVFQKCNKLGKPLKKIRKNGGNINNNNFSIRLQEKNTEKETENIEAIKNNYSLLLMKTMLDLSMKSKN